MIRENQKEINWLVDEKYAGKLTKAAEKDIARLKAGEPVSYLIGFVEFLGYKMDLSLKPLIPRPETEYWTQKAIQDIRTSLKQNVSIRCLDVFSGSGCIGIAVSRHILQARVDFAENEKKFLQQIQLNLKKNRVSKKRFKVIQSDVFSGVPGKYDYIFANPPYIATTRWKSVQSSVARYEPRGALFAGKDGLRYIKRFLKEAKNHLTPKGKIYMEFDSPQRKEIDLLLKKYRYSSWQFYKDQYGKWRFVVVSLKQN